VSGGGALFAAFALASLVLAATPGPGVLYIVTRTLAQGRGAGLASVAGVALGNLGNALAAALGLAALFAVSSVAFRVLQLGGAAYLLWLGWQALRAAPAPAAEDGAPVDAPGVRRIFRDGFLVALLNPKTALFFAAFLPQFVPAGASPWHSVWLGVTFVAIASCTDLLYVLAAGQVAPRLRRFGAGRGLGRWLSAGVYLALGLLALAAGPRTAAAAGKG
jgi:threonine/homoserine/homoserine lactone efflux protein